MQNKVITIATFVGFTNRGAEALLRTRIASIREHLPQTTFKVLTVYTDSCQPIEGVEYIQTFGGQREKLTSLPYLIKALLDGMIWTFEAIRFRLTGKTSKREMRAIATSDAFISTDGDVLGEDYGLLPYIWRLYYLGLGLLLKKPVFIFAEGLGPFNTSLAKFISRLFFNRCAYISVRDELSYDYTFDLGINQLIEVVADSAFLLEPEIPQKEVYRKKNRKLIGVAVSKLATKYGFKSEDESDPYLGFTKYMGQIIDWMVEELSTEVILIPHVVQVQRDDFATAQDILQQVKNKNSVSIVDKTTNARQLKGIIAGCDLLIASRMHAIIAGLSSHVPVVGIAYSHKARGLFNAVQLKSIIDIQNLNHGLKDMIKDTLTSSEAIRKMLRSNVARMQQLARIPGQRVAEVVKEVI